MSSGWSKYEVGDVGPGARVAQGENISIGIPPEQLPAILKAATDPLKRLNEGQNSTIAKLESQLGATKEQILGFFRILGEANIQPDAIPVRLYQIAERYKLLLAQAAFEPGDDPEMAKLKVELRAALGKPDLERADALLAEILVAQDRNIEHRALLAASTCAQRGELARTRLRYNEAASHFAGAAVRVPAAHEAERFGYLFQQAVAFYSQGDEFGDNTALWAAANILRALLTMCSRDRAPLDWARMQMNLGTALATLGARESGTARLEEAVAAFCAALEEITRDRAPLQLAKTQMNLGTALRTLGARESGTVRLEEAVTAYRAALEETTRDRVPLQWAETQMNLGIALASLGKRESGTARLEEAVAAFCAALEETTRDRVPLQWAMIKMSLGNALLALGVRESGTARLEEAVTAYRAALAEMAPDRVPSGWARTQMNLGNALQALGERESGTARLEEGVAVYDGALQMFLVSRPDNYEAICRSSRARACALLEDRRK